MGRNIKSNWLFIVCLLFGGCMYGDKVTPGATAISGKSYPATTAMPEVYFDDNMNHLSGPYEQVAFIEVKGAKYSDTGALLEEMKKKGAALGADAIIAIKPHYISRERGEVLGEILDSEKNKPESYDTIALTGIAVKYK